MLKYYSITALQSFYMLTHKKQKISIFMMIKTKLEKKEGGIHELDDVFL